MRTDGLFTNNYLSGMIMVVVWPNFNHNCKKVLYTHTVVQEWELTSMTVPLISAIRRVETNNLWVLVESLYKSNCLLQTHSHGLALIVLSLCHIVITNKIEPKKPKNIATTPNCTLFCSWAR